MTPLKKHSDWKLVNKIVKVLQDHGFTAWLAGGCVRDALLNRQPQDFDIATNARPEQIEPLFEKTLAVGKSFGVIKVIENKAQVDVVTFRREGNYLDGRRPETVDLCDP